MKRELTKRVIVEKSIPQNEEDVLKKIEQYNGTEFISDIELVSHQVIYSPETFIPKKILLFGMSINDELLNNTTYLLGSEKRKILLEEIQDDLSVKIWDKLKTMTTDDSYKRINNPDTSDIVESFFSFIETQSMGQNEKLSKYNFIKKPTIDKENIQTLLASLVAYKLDFRCGSLKLEDLNSLESCSRGIFYELYFKFHQQCVENSYKLIIYSISSMKLYTDKYESHHGFVIQFCFSDINGNLVRY